MASVDLPNETTPDPIESFRHACGREYILSDFEFKDEYMCKRCETLVKNPWKDPSKKKLVLPDKPKPKDPVSKPLEK